MFLRLLALFTVFSTLVTVAAMGAVDVHEETSKEKGVDASSRATDAKRVETRETENAPWLNRVKATDIASKRDNAGNSGALSGDALKRLQGQLKDSLKTSVESLTWNKSRPAVTQEAFLDAVRNGDSQKVVDALLHGGNLSLTQGYKETEKIKDPVVQYVIQRIINFARRLSQLQYDGDGRPLSRGKLENLLLNQLIFLESDPALMDSAEFKLAHAVWEVAKNGNGDIPLMTQWNQAPAKAIVSDHAVFFDGKKSYVVNEISDKNNNVTLYIDGQPIGLVLKDDEIRAFDNTPDSLSRFQLLRDTSGRIIKIKISRLSYSTLLSRSP